MNGSAVMKFKDQVEAEEMAQSMRNTGWKGAKVVFHQEGYFITTHSQYCKCGMCPYLRKNGFMES